MLPAVLGLACLYAGSAHAAGGHHAVDDAALVEPGQCQLETWQERSQSGDRRLNHVGPACNWQGLEWGLNLEGLRWRDGRHDTQAGPQLKWATPLAGPLSVGLAVGGTWSTHDARYLGSTVVLPVTWQATPAWTVHANLGQDLQPGAGPQSRRGLAAEWMPAPAWSLVAERFDDHGERHWRGGGRYVLSDQVSLDLSRAAVLGAHSRPWWAFGVNWSFSPGAR